MTLSDLLNTITELAKSLKERGEAFNASLLPEQLAIYRDMDMDIVPDWSDVQEEGPRDLIPFDACIALTSSWLVYSAQATHAVKVLSILRSGNMALIGKLRHPRGNAVRLTMRVWMPLLSKHPSPWYPSAKDLRPFYKAHVRDDVRACRWGVLAPIKLYAIANGWSDAEINKFIPPLGWLVRVALLELLGFEVANPETTSSYHQAYNLQKRLAVLAGTNVAVINSGLWRAGEQFQSAQAKDEGESSDDEGEE